MLTGCAAVLIGVGAALALVPAVVGISAGYGVLQLVLIVTEARMQDAITGPARATVTSVAGLGSEVLAMLLYLGFAVGSLWWGYAALVTLFAGAPRAAARWRSRRSGAAVAAGSLSIDPLQARRPGAACPPPRASLFAQGDGPVELGPRLVGPTRAEQQLPRAPGSRWPGRSRSSSRARPASGPSASATATARFSRTTGEPVSSSSSR